MGGEREDACKYCEEYYGMRPVKPDDPYTKGEVDFAEYVIRRERNTVEKSEEQKTRG